MSPLPTVCTKTVTVTPLTAPTCLVERPSHVSEGALDQYFHVNPSELVANVAWSITGNGAIGATPSSYGVMITVGDPGTFDLTATITTSDLRTNSCTRTVTADTLACAITGAAPMAAGPTDNVYTAGPPRIPARDIAVVDDTPQPAGNQDAKLLIHLAPTTTTEPCGPRGAPACNAAVTTGTLSPTTYFAYLLVGDANATVGVQGLECGIDYNAGAHSGVDIFSWNCASRDDIIGGTGFPPVSPSRLGFATFTAGGTAPGYNPCAATVPVRVTTWSTIKSMYGS